MLHRRRQTIGVGAGQQSRIHCTRLAGQKADNWQLRHMDKVLNLPFRDDIAKPNRDNAIDVYIGDTPEDVIGDDVWAETFTEQPAPLTAEEKKEYLSKVTGVCLGSDAFFPFGDNIERARRSGVTAIVQPGGSIRDQQVIDTCNKYGIAWPSAACGCSITKRRCKNEQKNSGGWRRRPRTCHHQALKKSPDCGEIWCAPGNGGIRYDAKCKNIKATDVETMVALPLRKSLTTSWWPRMTRWPWAWWTSWQRPASRPLARIRPLPASSLQGVLQGPDEEIRHPHRKVRDL